MLGLLVFAVPDAAGTGAVRDDLILRIAQKDMSALRELYDLTETGLFGFALSILKNRQDAEDAVQNSYLKLMANAAGYRPQGKPMAWLYTIVRRECMDMLRDGRRTTGYVDGLRSEPDDGMQEAQIADRVVLQAALSALGAEERELVMLHSVSGMKYREIALVLELPLSTVISKCNRAFKKLRLYLEEQEANVG